MAQNQYQQKDNQGALFPNSKKTTPNHPDFTGTILIGGKDYWISGWKKLSKNGAKKYMSLAVKPKEVMTGKPAQTAQAAQSDPWG